MYECLGRDYSQLFLLFSLSPPSQQGQVDCWPLPCPPVDCEFTMVPEGECCPRCVTDPCQADTIRNDITKTCTDEHNISRFSGSSWIKHGTECTLCQCKVRRQAWLADANQSPHWEPWLSAFQKNRESARWSRLCIVEAICASLTPHGCFYYT